MQVEEDQQMEYGKVQEQDFYTVALKVAPCYTAQYPQLSTIHLMIPRHMPMPNSKYAYIQFLNTAW